MKATLKIEVKGDGFYQYIDKYFKEKLKTKLPSSAKSNCWCAKITGSDEKYEYKREFIKPRKDYAKSNYAGTKGIFLWFILDSDFIYQISEGYKRYFCHVTNDGDVEQISKEFVDQWIKDRSELQPMKPPSNE